MAKTTRGARIKGAGLLLVVLLGGCASGTGNFKQVVFQAPSQPEPEVRPFIERAEKIGVLSATNIQPLKELDVEKVMGRLADATARGLSAIPKKAVVTQDEIRWRFKGTAFDSTSVFSPETRAALHREMGIDALVYVELKSLKAQITPMSPSPYGGLVNQPGLDLSVDLQVTLLNVHTGESWSQKGGQKRNWQPVQMQLFGDNQSERQLLTALAGPLYQFLSRLAPPPTQQVRYFDRGE